jgi:hypothetical protein
MKVIVGAALSAFLLAGTALAQPAETPATPPAAPAGPPAQSACAAVAPPPTLPDGASATAQQMTAGNEAFNAWITTANTSLTCRREEAQAAIARAESLRDQFNATAQSITTTRDAWLADVNEYNAAHPPRGRGQR